MSLFDHQLKWELLKYEFRKFTTKYTKHVAKEKWQQIKNLENQLKNLEKSLDENTLSKYNSVQNQLDVIYDHIAKGIQIRANATAMNNTPKNQ